MLENIKNKIQFAAIVAPAYAALDPIKIETSQTSGFKGLMDLTPAGIVSGAIGLLMLGVALIFFFILILGGIKWVTSEGDEKKVGAARAQITNGLIGLAIVFASWAIMKLIETVFGISIIGSAGLVIPTFK